LWVSQPENRLADDITIRVEVHDWMQRLTMDILGHSVLGHDLHALAGPENPALKYYRDVTASASRGLYFIFPRLDRWYNPFRYTKWASLWGLNREFQQMIDGKRQMIASITEEVDEKQKDLLWMMLEALEGDSGATMTDKEIRV